MEKIFYEVDSLDRYCYEKYYLSEEILMEHASLGMYNYLKKFKSKKIFIISGSGNNGADGITLARLLFNDFKVYLYLTSNLKENSLANKQLKRFLAIGGKVETNLKKLKKADIIVDCIFGSGLNRTLSNKYIDLLKLLNQQKAKKIACDIPSGLNKDGKLMPICFKADITFTMGGLKEALFSDIAKDYVGKIKVINLGISKDIYQKETNSFLLTKKDFNPPIRNKKNSHKGNFGHLVVVSGEKKGASEICAINGFKFGAGLVSILGKSSISYIMQTTTLPKNTTAICIGMGLGNVDYKKILDNDIKKVIDADMFYKDDIKNYLKNCVITPHPKEFVSLLKILNLATISIEELQNNRFYYAKMFSKYYPDIVLVLKGANILIAYQNKIYINPLCTQILSKGGSGDALSGFIGSLLAQGRSLLDSAINATLALCIYSNRFKKENFSFTPIDFL